MRLERVAYMLLITIAIVIILIVGKDLIIPLIVALIVWFLIKEIRSGLKKIKWVRKTIPSWLLSTIAFIIIFLVISLITKLLIFNIQELSKSLTAYQANVSTITSGINKLLKIDILNEIKDFIGDFDFTGLLTSVFTSITEIISDAFLILIYTLFLLLEETFFSVKIKALYPNIDKFREMNLLLKKIDNSISRYLVLKTIVSVVTGILSYIVLISIGVDAPLFWAFIIFILNYIPTIGSLIATLFPTVFAFLQFGEILPGVLVLTLVGAVQLVMGNLVEPRLMGDSLNISPLVVILSLTFWGAIWGILGMVLSVPMVVMIIIITSEIPATRFIAVMLSKKGV
ncbi:MAG: AI-2E family transporter [Bacteroidales bacterium]|nr:AI-2E family transporter [Bacteroidales bacterium]